MNSKSLKLNMTLSAVKGVLGVLFPLITFPYISKVLGVDSVGKYNFGASVVSYFVLLANLGITDYALRESAAIRENKEKLNKFVSEIFTINVGSMIISYILLAVCLCYVQKLQGYQTIILVLALQLLLRTFGVEWVLGAHEDYVYITLRSIAFQILSLISMFALVHKPEDYIIYAGITVISSAGNNVLNSFRARKYCRIRFTCKPHLKQHMKPIMFIFATSVAISIYVNSDVTILGFMHSDYVVGIYSVSVKIYNVVKTFLSSMLVVAVPRMAAIYGKGDKKQFKKTATNVLEMLLTLILPSMIGIFMLSREIVIIVSDASYLEAVSSLQILSIALIFSLGAWFFSYCILIPMKGEKLVFIATILSAVVNVVLNLFFIPIWAERAAAVTTLISEILCFIILIKKSYVWIDIRHVCGICVKVILGCVAIFIVGKLIGLLNLAMVVYTIIVIVISVVIYGVVEISLKNEAIYSIFLGMKKKVIRK